MPRREDPAWLCVGRVNKPHGIKGEAFVSSLTDHPEGVYAPGVVVRGADAAGRAPDPALAPLRIETVRPYRQGFLVRFAGYPDRTAVEGLRGRYLLRSADDVEPLGEDEVFYHQLLGMTVETVEGRRIGTVREVYELQPNDLLDVRTATGSLLIPFVRTMVTEVHRDEGRLVVDPPEGLLDL
jgi:16S rRNA processing protein RimM